MTIEIFLKNLLESQNLEPTEETALKAHKKEVTDFLRSEFGEAPVIKYAGSYEKGTLIRDSYDLDIVCYFPSTDTRTLKEIRNNVAAHLQKKYLVEEKTSALRITNLKNGGTNGYHIDVVPGRFIAGSSDVFLHVFGGDKDHMQTNLKTHISTITESGCIDAIRLAKLWAIRNNVGIKTFVLELFVVNALSGSRSKNDLKMSFLTVLRAFNDDFGKVRLVDPANSANIVSDLIPPSARALISNAASTALNNVEKSDDLSRWGTIFGETTFSGPSTPTMPSGGFAPHSPWRPSDGN